jgi:methylated-DNA-[protein]-cysteine S-methyltransferase
MSTPDISVIFTVAALGRLAVTATDAGIRSIRLLGPGGWSATGGGHGSHPHLDRCRYELAAYATGRLRVFTVPVDLAGLPPFTRAVLTKLRAVPWGTTITYGALASCVGKPGAGRAVGQALNRNPVPIVIPCHRVLAAHGPGGFALGVEMKNRLLALEGVKD